MEEEDVVVAGHRAYVSILRFTRDDGRVLVAIQAFLPTWRRPTVIYPGHLTAGRFVAEGLVIEHDGTVNDAPDELMVGIR
jgi:hypothetical protein